MTKFWSVLRESLYSGLRPMHAHAMEGRMERKGNVCVGGRGFRAIFTSLRIPHSRLYWTVLSKEWTKGPRDKLHFCRVSNQKLQYSPLRSKLFTHQKSGHPEGLLPRDFTNCSSVVSLAESVVATTFYIKGREVKAYSQGSRSGRMGPGWGRAKVSQSGGPTAGIPPLWNKRETCGPGRSFPGLMGTESEQKHHPQSPKWLQTHMKEERVLTCHWAMNLDSHKSFPE